MLICDLGGCLELLSDDVSRSNMFGLGEILITIASEVSEQKVLKISLKKTLVVSCHISKMYEKNRAESLQFSLEGWSYNIKSIPQRQTSCCAQAAHPRWIFDIHSIKSFLIGTSDCMCPDWSMALRSDSHFDCCFEDEFLQNKFLKCK